ncbi:aldo/keto reductase [Curtobacterium oceanosedimentum]|uniref:aldo/keto reductase n=1 Tax=Curtobacterium oceanosedimentum TaxID=465820 RepID=UPI001CE14E97|nr:aldo/keto reductase [Curtobacterium oceanosedimentum]MCA5924604.1 aldo/keto reductase [Curtobacterium oceanosedimentum]
MRDIDIRGRRLAPAVLGTMTFGDSVDEPTAAEMVDRFLAAGGTGIDTANGYAGGRSEEILGSVLAGRRDDVVLATKVGIPNPDAEGAAPLSAEAIDRCVRASLRRLRTDHVDVLYLHQPDRSTPAEETLAAVRTLVESGSVGAWGISNFSAWQIAELGHTATALGLDAPVLGQQVYSVIATRIDDEYAEYAGSTGLGTVVYNPLGGGLLTGKHRPEEQPAAGRFGSSPLAGMYRSRYWNDEVFAAVEQLRSIAEGSGIPMAELALRWTFGRPVVDAVLVGGSRLANIEANLTALAAGALPDDVQQAVDDVSAALRGPMPGYNR